MEKISTSRINLVVQLRKWFGWHEILYFGHSIWMRNFKFQSFTNFILYSNFYVSFKIVEFRSYIKFVVRHFSQFSPYARDFPRLSHEGSIAANEEPITASIVPSTLVRRFNRRHVGLSSSSALGHQLRAHSSSKQTSASEHREQYIVRNQPSRARETDPAAQGETRERDAGPRHHFSLAVNPRASLHRPSDLSPASASGPPPRFHSQYPGWASSSASKLPLLFCGQCQGPPSSSESG